MPNDRSTVWATGQRFAHHQRSQRYVAYSREHPAKMPPAIARSAIATYSKTGDTVLDPMCGIGTVLIEAIEAGRRGWGVDYEPEWVAATAANLHLARQRYTNAAGQVWRGDARQLTTVLPQKVQGAVDLVVTSPPYGSSTHGYWPAGRAEKILRANDSYGPRRRDKAQLAHQSLSNLRTGVQTIIAETAHILRSGGTLVLTARPWSRRGLLVDFPALITEAALATKAFTPVERCVALLARWDNPRLVAHHSFFRLHNVRNARAKGQRPLIPAHEDILVFRRLP